MFTRLRVIAPLLALITILFVAVPLVSAQTGSKEIKNFSDNLKSPQSARQQALRAEALKAQMQGKTSGNVYRTESGKFVELSKTSTDLIWTVLGEFGNGGPSHNEIKKPNRRQDNATIWRKNYTPAYYEKLLFSNKPNANSMRNYYLEQSSNLYTVDGEVSNWVTVPYGAAHYGNNNCGDIVCSNIWLFVQDSLNAWYDSQIASGKSPAEINAYLAKFDVWDRYDYDTDGNFNEPDGYIDHFQTIHAGEGEETGGGPQGTDAIWSHRWFAYFNLIGSAGPDFNKFGGVHIGNSDYWVGDYTVEPENGGLGVFAHEFGHDLGLPDLYDTSGNTGGAENSTGFWTLYSSGSYGSDGNPKHAIGTKPIHMSALEKILLGWSHLGVLGFGNEVNVTMGPAEYTTQNIQQLIINLPDKAVSTDIGAAYAGTHFYYSDTGNDVDNSMTRSVTLPGGNPSLSAKVRYSIEEDWDYAYLIVNGTPVHTNLSTNDSPNGQNFGEGITGSSGGAWVDLTADLTAYAGQTVDIGFRYWTDSFTSGSGFRVDELAIPGQATDGAETDPGWTFDGFFISNGTVETEVYNAYIVENRQYLGYDKSLQTGPYNFGFLDNPALGNFVEHFPYQNGLLVWYYDTSFEDNNVGDHCLSGRCGGLFLPVDAHPNLLVRPDGQVWRPRVQSFDSTFGLEPTDKLCLHFNSDEKCYGPFPAVKEFDDTKNYWRAPNPSVGNFGWSSVPLPSTGTHIKVLSTNPNGNLMDISIKFDDLNK